MWYIITCKQARNNGVNVYHPRDCYKARETAAQILNGTHIHGGAPCVHLQMWNSLGQLVRARLCRTVSDVESWLNETVMMGGH